MRHLAIQIWERQGLSKGTRPHAWRASLKNRALSLLNKHLTKIENVCLSFWGKILFFAFICMKKQHSYFKPMCKSNYNLLRCIESWILFDPNWERDFENVWNSAFLKHPLTEGVFRTCYFSISGNVSPS